MKFLYPQKIGINLDDDATFSVGCRWCKPHLHPAGAGDHLAPGPAAAAAAGLAGALLGLRLEAPVQERADALDGEGRHQRRERLFGARLQQQHVHPLVLA